MHPRQKPPDHGNGHDKEAKPVENAKQSPPFPEQLAEHPHRTAENRKRDHRVRRREGRLKMSVHQNGAEIDNDLLEKNIKRDREKIVPPRSNREGATLNRLRRPIH